MKRRWRMLLLTLSLLFAGTTIAFADIAPVSFAPVYLIGVAPWIILIVVIVIIIRKKNKNRRP